jgi:hypothetical protein
MTKVYELPNGHRLVADFDENGIAKVTEQALDRLIDDLNYYADMADLVKHMEFVKQRAVKELKEVYTPKLKAEATYFDEFVFDMKGEPNDGEK